MTDLSIQPVHDQATGGLLKTILRWILAWLAAAVLTTVLGTVFQTQRLLSQLNNVDGAVTLGERVSTSVYDLVRFGTLYGLFVLVATLAAFLAGSLVYHYARFGRPVVFAVAGGVAMAVMLIAMKQVFFGVQIVGGARDPLGFTLQVAAGVLGGLAFAGLSSGGRVAR